MGVEIERKYLPLKDWQAAVEGITGMRVEQAYLPPGWLQLTDQEGVGHLWLDSPEIQKCGPAFAYLVDRDDVDALRELCQGEYSVRVRIKGDKKAYLTIKSATPGTTRGEFEYKIPVVDARKIFELGLYQGSIIVKMRYSLPCGPGVKELVVDQFFYDNQGLVVAEVELENEDTPFILPDWFGAEVTNDRRYYNEQLSQTPYQAWPEAA